MKRREAFKKIGALALLGGGGITLINACANTAKEATVTAAATTEIPVEKVKTEREKLIINRNRNKIADPANPTKSELKHSPDISFGEQDSQGHTLIKVTIGQQGIIHPSTKEHWIDSLTLFVNDIQLAYIEYINGGIRAYDNFYVTLNKGDKVSVDSACNLHGIYNTTVIFE